MVARVGPADGEDVRQTCRHEAAAPSFAVVPHGRDDDRPAAQRAVDRLLEQHAESEETAAGVDDAASASRDSVEACKDLGEQSVAEVPFLQRRLWVDTDQSDAVRRGGDDRADGCSVFGLF